MIDHGNAKTVLLAGDYNLDLKKCNTHSATEDFLNNLLAYSYSPTILHPTRISERSATLIDNIFVKSLCIGYDSIIIYNDISDHFPVAIHLASNLNSKKALKSRKARRFDTKSIENFVNDLDHDTRWVDVNNLCVINNNPSSAYELFHSIYKENFDKCFQKE